MADDEAWSITVRYVPSDKWLVLTGVPPAWTVRRLKQYALDVLRSPSWAYSSTPELQRSLPDQLSSSPPSGARPATAGDALQSSASWGKSRNIKSLVSYLGRFKSL
jgi:hypothetical protein